MATFDTRKFAVVTGASSGIGLELARQFAINNFDVMIAAENPDIYPVAEELKMAGVNIMPVQVNLAGEHGVAKLWQEIKNVGRPIDAIAINAGVGVGGSFVETDLAEELNMIALNITSSVVLAKYVVKDMLAYNQGRILFTASIASVVPAPFMAVYGGTKAFLLSFSEALRNELKDTNVTVTALMPGATDTEFFRRAHMEDTKVGADKKDDPIDVARDGFKALMAGKDHVVSHSAKTIMMEWMGEILPETVKAQMHRRETEPGSGLRH
jgi:uncharacterized protein